MYAPCGQRHSEGVSFRHFRGEILATSNHGEGLRGFVVRGNYMKSCGYFVRRGNNTLWDTPPSVDRGIFVL